MDSKIEHGGGSDRPSSSQQPVRRLGRGLGSLIPSSSQSTSAAMASATPPQSALDSGVAHVPRGTVVQSHPDGAINQMPGDVVRQIPVTLITPNPHQPRDSFNEASIAELADSIRTAGLLQPIVVRPSRSSDGVERYEIIAGERRWRAMKKLGQLAIPAIVKEATERESAQLALIENVQRDDLNAAERAFALRSLAEQFGLSHQQVAEAVGIDRPTVSNLIRLTELDGRSLDLVRLGKLSAGHARALLGIRDVASRSLLADTAIMEEWSVRTLEREVQRSADRANSKAVSRGTTSAPVRSAHLSSLEDRLSKSLGTRVHLQLGRQKGSGRMTIEFFSLEQFDGLLLKLGVPPNNV